MRSIWFLICLQQFGLDTTLVSIVIVALRSHFGSNMLIDNWVVVTNLGVLVAPDVMDLLAICSPPVGRLFFRHRGNWC